MEDHEKTKEHLVQELSEMRERLERVAARADALEKRCAESYQSELEQRAEELTRTKDFLQGILDSSTLVSVVLTDLDQSILFWNKGAENIFGYGADEVIGTSITRLYPPDALSEEAVEQLRKGIQTKTGTVHGRMKQLTKDGREVFISLAVSPRLDTDGEVQGILGMGLDVTEEVRQQNEIIRLLEQVKKTQDVAVFSLAKLAESRDQETGAHLIRIQEYSRVLSQALAGRAGFEGTIDQDFVDDLVQASVLHDIGKVGIPDAILLSPDKFGPEERKIMQQHTVIGGKALEEAVVKLGEKSFLTRGMEVAYHHHERWDGSGYPFGLTGPQIPLSARIVALADVYDALTTRRRYKDAFSHERAEHLITEAGGRQFDPELVEAFLMVSTRFDEIAREYADHEPDFITQPGRAQAPLP